MTLEIPFQAPNLYLKSLTPFDGRHRTLWAAILPLETKWLLIYREASDHPYDGNSQIRMQITQSKGMHFTPPVTIYDEANVDARGCTPFAMDDGRIGILCCRLSATGYDLAPVFLYSDNEGASWTSHVLSGPVGWTQGTLAVHRMPGGGFIAYSSVTTALGAAVHYLKSVDNGVTWTSGVAIAGVPGLALATLAIVRLGTSDRWVMLARRQGGDLSTYAYKSTDMLTWDGPFDTGQNLADNPHNAMYWNGMIYWLACSRVTAGGETPRPLGPIQDGFVHQWADAEDLWDVDFESGWPGWSECAPLFGMEGHPTFFTENQSDGSENTYAVFGFNRSTTNNSTSIGLMGPTAMVTDFSAANNVVRPLTAADRTIAAGGDLVHYSGHQQSLATGTYTTIFDKTGNIELLSCIIFGSAVGYRLTIDGRVVVTNTGVVQADDNAGDRFSDAIIPAAKALSSMKVEAYNAASATKNIAWRAMTREW
jgi:hypothetical protein